jgi:L-asparagine oxygenase
MTIVNLEHVDITVLKNLERRITSLASENPELFCKQIKYASAQLPIHITLRLMDFAYRGSPSGFLLFDNLPKENLLPETPPGNTLKIGEKTRLAQIQGILISAIGDMIAYEAEGYGRLFQDVVPIQTMAKNQTSLSSDAELEIHTEQAFSKLRPDILSLVCLRGDKNAYTYILPVGRIIENLTRFEIQMLREPLWMIGVDLSFKLHGQSFIDGDVRGPIAILSGPEDDPTLIFDQDLMKGTTPEAENLVKKIVEIYYNHRIAHCLQPGEIIFVDNRRAVHGRSAFSPKYDGYDRFMVRCFATLDYEKSAHARNGCTVEAIYS